MCQICEVVEKKRSFCSSYGVSEGRKDRPEQGATGRTDRQRESAPVVSPKARSRPSFALPSSLVLAQQQMLALPIPSTALANQPSAMTYFFWD